MHQNISSKHRLHNEGLKWDILCRGRLLCLHPVGSIRHLASFFCLPKTPSQPNKNTEKPQRTTKRHEEEVEDHFPVSQTGPEGVRRGHIVRRKSWDTVEICLLLWACAESSLHGKGGKRSVTKARASLGLQQRVWVEGCLSFVLTRPICCTHSHFLTLGSNRTL